MANHYTDPSAIRKHLRILEVYEEEVTKRKGNYGGVGAAERTASIVGCTVAEVKTATQAKGNGYAALAHARHDLSPLIGLPLDADPPRDSRGRRADYYTRPRRNNT